MPPGTVPPFVTRFDAGSVAVGELVFSSDNYSEGELQNMALNQVRPLFATLEGVSAPPPFGGNQRSIVITLDPDKLWQYQIRQSVGRFAVPNKLSSCRRPVSLRQPNAPSLYARRTVAPNG